MNKRVLLLLSFVFSLQLTSAQEISGKWYSKTMLDNKEVHLIFDLRKNKKDLVGYVDLPSEKIFRVKLDSVNFADHTVYIAQKGLNLSFKGKVDRLKNTIPGQIKLKESNNSLVLTREPHIDRIQVVQEPTPYISRNIVFFNRDSTKLAGTITFPKTAGTKKAVILISGSGPQDRDSEILGHKPFEILADHLTRKGIAVLRFDDRGYGQSEGQFRPATSEDYSQDVIAAINFLNNYEEVSLDSIGLIGHSEGGNIAPMVAAKNNEVDFLVLLAAPGTSNYESYLVSLDLLLKDYPETYERDFSLYKSVYRDMSNIEDREVLTDSLTMKFKRYAESLTEEEVSMYGGIDNFISDQIDAHTTKWYHYYLQFDVTEYLKKLKIPILALNGDKDTSVEADFNLAGIEKTLSESGNNEFKTLKLKDVNHFFQTSKDDKIESVYFNEETFSKEALVEISSWIKSL